MDRKFPIHPPSKNAGSPDRFATRRQFWRDNMWRLLAWPGFAIVAAVLGWGVLLSHLAAERQSVELDVLSNAQTLAAGYAEQALGQVDTIEQAARFVKYQWQASGGTVHLGFADENGLFVHSARLVAFIIDPQGRVITASAPTAISAAASSRIVTNVGRGATVNFLLDQVQIQGRRLPTRRLLFAWDLTDRNGKFEAALVIGVDPAAFTAGYGDAVYKYHGLLAIVGDDGLTRALRSESSFASTMQPGFLHAPHLDVSSGSMIAKGPQWFGDGRDRIVGWKHLERRGVNALVGFDYQTALAPYNMMRVAWIRSGQVLSVALFLFTVLGLTYSLRLARRNQELHLIESTYRMATEASNEGFYMLRPQYDEQGKIEDFEVIDCNRRAAELVAHEAHELIGKHLADLYHGAVLEERLGSLRIAMESGYHEIDLERPISTFPAQCVHLKLMRYGDNLAVSARDVTKERLHAAELLRRSNEDQLTGLPNRNWVESYLPQAISRAEQANATFALLFVDLDGFKAINDSWGHAAGDELLRMAADRLKDAVRPHGCVTRFGGDEFVIVLEDIANRFDATQVSERILRAFRQSIQLSYGEYAIGVSIGISMFPVDGREPRRLLQNADIAMYSVKTNERGNYRFFDGRFHDKLKARLERIRELRHALAYDQFVMHYEPRVSLAEGTITSFEALVRWMHPSEGLLAPVEFIPLVEETGLVLQLGELVIDKVCAQLARWREHGEQLVPVSINVSPRQLNNTDVAKTLRLALERHGVSPDLIEVELTESSVMDETGSALSSIQAIQRAGIKVLLDDFGTGYSSLSQLYRLHFDGLKIDRAFILQLGKTEGGTVIVTAIITMARALGMRVVAEGVELMDQVDMLRALGCDEIQGYLISKARPPAASQPVANNFVLMD
jgi:diguanylate cyclase